uniref:Sushi domain-containing protein n=1 Tax=Echeneis naucrates TaxID=173247 RepID=A0A665TN61_ECHNA
NLNGLSSLTLSHVSSVTVNLACFPPTIPNGKYTESSDGWYEERHILRIRCDPGYEQLNQIATASCLNGTWSPLPICESNITSCSSPPKIPHAVVNQKYQEVFAADSEVVYQCETGYATEEGHTNTSIYCVAGSWSWSEASSCNVMYQCVDGYAINTWSNKQNIFCRAGRWDELQPCRKRSHFNSLYIETEVFYPPVKNPCIFEFSFQNGYLKVVQVVQNNLLIQGYFLFCSKTEWEKQKDI